MVDWVGNDGVATAERYRFMADAQLGPSPSYRALCLGVADDSRTLALLDTLPPAKRQPNLLLAAVRYLDGPIDDYAAFRSFVSTSWDELAALMQVRRTQTNEASRCATMLPALAAIDGPLALLEVGASAGLCLVPDRYAYRYDDGPVLGSSPVLLECDTDGAVPIPTRLPEIVWRVGLDLNPLDISDEDTLRWLECLVWPEQTARLDVLRRAAELVGTDPPSIVVGDATADLVGVAARAPADATLVVAHSAMLSYVDEPGRDSFRAQVEAIAARRPAVWLSNEAPGVVVAAVAPGAAVPFVLARDGEGLAFTDPHGSSITWW